MSVISSGLRSVFEFAADKFQNSTLESKLGGTLASGWMGLLTGGAAYLSATGPGGFSQAPLAVGIASVLAYGGIQLCNAWEGGNKVGTGMHAAMATTAVMAVGAAGMAAGLTL